MNEIPEELREEQRRMMIHAIKHIESLFPGVGIGLFLFHPEMDQKENVNYIGNTDRAQLLLAIQEFVRRNTH